MPHDSWTLLNSRYIAKYKVLRLREDRYRFEPTRAEADFVVADSVDWAMVIPITDGGEVVFIRQYRHGVRQVVLEIPGGLLDPDEPAEETAERELREETGYAAQNVRRLGQLLPNPAHHNAHCHVFVAEGCRLAGDQRLDPFEQIEVVPRPLDAVDEMMRNGELCHAQVIAAFALMKVA